MRAAAESPIPLISAVGHETDTTLIDFAADRRAPTPTAAAEMAVPVRAELAALLAELGHRLSACVTRTRRRAPPSGWSRSRAAGPRPRTCSRRSRQRLDDAGERLPRALIAAHRPCPRRPGRGRAAAPGATAHRTGRRARRRSWRRCGGWPSWPIPSGRCSAASSGSPTARARRSSTPPMRARPARSTSTLPTGGWPPISAMERGRSRSARQSGLSASGPSSYPPGQPGLFDSEE